MIYRYAILGNTGFIYFPCGSQCRQTKAVPGDGIDNDCDGNVDEEVKDGKDNDGDKYVDEDLELVNE